MAPPIPPAFSWPWPGAGFSGPGFLQSSALTGSGANHVVWTTGGSLVPDAQYQDFLQRALKGQQRGQ